MAIIQAKKNGNSVYLRIPAHICHQANIKGNEKFNFVRDNLLPDVFILTKIVDADKL